ncbi:hypothetical protein [Cytobacillus sp. FSL R7-0680]|uniref:hypothetical protein n=1 Tax=Cytobacillus sp. FSL R7-0680 TaxID=2921689 RepID=UPI0030FBE669
MTQSHLANYSDVKLGKVGKKYDREDFINYLDLNGFVVLTVEKKENLHEFAVIERLSTVANQRRTIYVEVDENNKIEKISIFHGIVHNKKVADNDFYLGLVIVSFIIFAIGYFLFWFFRNVI